MTSRAPRVLVVTTNFPLRERGDVTANFVVDPVVALARDGSVEQRVVAPLDTHRAARRERFAGVVDVRRFRSWAPRRRTAVPYGDGIPTNVARSWAARLQLPFFALALLFAVARHARWADVVHAHWLPTALVALPVCRLLGRPLVVTLHGTDVTQLPTWATAPVLRRVDVVVTAHEDLAALVRRLAPGTRLEQVRHLVEPQPVPAEAARELDAWLDGAPLALFVARLSPERDPVTFVRAAARVREQVPTARFAVVGDGVLAEDVEREVAAAGLGDVVLRTGHRPDVWTFLGRATAFAALSDRNNIWVTALVEAMRGGVPCVVTRAGDSARVLTHDEDALLVDVGDAAAVADQLVRLLTDPDLARRIADGAGARLERAGFAPEVVKARTVALYRELADR